MKGEVREGELPVMVRVDAAGRGGDFWKDF